ncbi:isochorismatase family cysteine hydrolase, partial [Xanthomonas campestris]
MLPKTSSGVFNSTNIDYVLRNLQTRHLIIAGIVTDQCVDMAVRDAADRGYLVTLVEDACATYTAERHHACLNAIKG